MTMNLLLWLSFALGCSSLTVPPQKPLGLGRIQEHVEKLSWDENLHCVPTISSAGNDTVCVQAVPYKEVHDPVMLGPPQYCGYVTLAYDKNKIFFWLVMSETGDPTTQPVVLWLNGGPGVSSLLGLWDQWGPRLFDHSKPGVAFLDNISKLTEKMTWIFLDQPANVGYSRTRPGGPSIKDSVAAAQDIVAFLDGILNTALFTFKGSNISLFAAPLHVAGESYAGHFIPAFGAEMAARQGQFNLTSLFIGNGLVDAAKFGPGVNELLCGPAAPTASFGISQSASLSSQCSIQTQRIKDCSVEISNCRAAPTGTAKATACGNAKAACVDSWGWAWGLALSRNEYDGTTDQNHILSQFSYYNTPAKTFLNEPTRKARFGVSKSTNWQWSNRVVHDEFDDSGDWFRSYIPEIGAALSAGIDVMLYVGDTDWVVPVTMVKAIAREVSWNEKDSHGGNPSFPMTKWRLCEKLGESKYSTISLPGSSTPYGNYVRSGHFNYVRVFGSGHMIQENHPKEAKHLFESWVLDRDSFQECIPV